MPDKQETAVVRYKASDGADVKLSPAIIQKYIVTGGQQVPDAEVFSFLAKCQARRLNPLAGDCYLTAYADRVTGGVKASVIVSKDYFVRTATQQPDFDGMRAGVVVATKDGLVYREGCIVGRSTEKLVGGWAEVHIKGRALPSRAEVSLDEYDKGRSLWKTMKATMIRKVALVQALREAYPQAYGGIYDADEMGGPDDAQPQPIQVEPAPEPVSEPMPEPEPPMSVDELKDEYGAVEVAEEDYDF